MAEGQNINNDSFGSLQNSLEFSLAYSVLQNQQLQIHFVGYLFSILNPMLGYFYLSQSGLIPIVIR